MMNGDLDESILSRDTELNTSLASKETAVLNSSAANGDVEAGYGEFCVGFWVDTELKTSSAVLCIYRG